MAYNYDLSQNNAWLGFARDNPQAMYNAFIPKGSSSFMDYFRNQYGNVYGKYMGQLGGQALSGQAPTLNFEDYLKDFPFLKEWWSQSPASRGERTPTGMTWRV